MQNLRDKLLKAGLVTQEQVEKSQKAEKKPPRREPESAEARQRAEAFALRDAELAEQRRKDTAKQSEARLQSERARSLRALIAEHRLHETLGEVPFHFVRRSGKVGRLALKPEVAKLLEDGAAAVLESLIALPIPAASEAAAANSSGTTTNDMTVLLLAGRLRRHTRRAIPRRHRAAT